MVGQGEMRRNQDWPEKLAGILEARADEPFKYGAHDCGLFVADCVLWMTGQDIADGLRGNYASAAELAELFGEDWLHRMDIIFDGLLADLEAIPVALARRGDIVMTRGEVFHALGICAGEDAFFTGPAGLVTHKTLTCVKAWRV